MYFQAKGVDSEHDAKEQEDSLDDHPDLANGNVSIID